ncbi:MAG: alpha-L-glutamate ligase [Gammaproteobacteria bacterium]|nr:alpha-L-glutamate ligase [Gammaproteobacteria bacterium]
MNLPARDPRVVIFTDEPGWHGRSLRRALAARGVEAVFLSLKEARFDIANGRHLPQLPGFEGALPRGVFVRGVPGGALESVILRLDVLHTLALLGVPVFNSGRAIERTVDKLLTSFLLSSRGVPTPATAACESPAEAQTFCAPFFAARRAVVLKPLFGSQGQGLVLVHDETQLAASVPVGGVFYVQEFLGSTAPPYQDWRVMVIDGRARFCMRRESAHWITNRAQGARCLAAPLETPLADLAEAAAAALEVDYAGVDLLRDPEGNWRVIEVNGIPAWWGLTQATGADVTGALVEAFLARLH